MAEYLIQDTTLDAIADAINAKTGGSAAMTPAEMAEAIAGIETGLSVPSYWEADIASAIGTINTLRSGIQNPFSTIFFTDVHWEDNNKNSPALIQEIMLKTGVNSAVCGGDLIVQQPTKAAAIALIESVRDKYSAFGTAYCVGNHDLNSAESTDSTAYLTEAEWCEMFPSALTGMTYYTHPSSGDATAFGYRDFADQKIREIFINTGVNVPSGASSNPVNNTHFSSALIWMCQRITELSSDWGVIIYQHIWWQPTGHMVEQSVVNTIRNYLHQYAANRSCELIAVVTGHCHDDYYDYDPTDGYLILSTTTDSGTAQAQLDEVNKIRTPGTTLEQAFDVITIDRANKMLYATRIGAGSSRALPYYYLASYTITGNYTNVTNSNQATTVQNGAAYTATITAASGYAMQTVSITMGGVDITSTAYNSSTGAISIASVTGNIVITAIAEASKPTWTNLVPSALSTTGAVYNTTGYKDGKYLSNTTATLEGGNDANFTLTGRIPYSQADFAAGKIICISGIDWTTDDHCRFIFLQTLTSASSTPYCKGSVTTSGGAQNIRTYFTLTQYSDYWTLTPIAGKVTTTALQYIAFSLKGSGVNLSIGVINP